MHPACPHPLKASDSGNGVYHCDSPCLENQYYNVTTWECVDTCQKEDIKTENGILLCDTRAKNIHQCLKIFDYKYPNGSCSPKCPAFADAWTNLNGENFCSPLCKEGLDYDWVNKKCFNACDAIINTEEEITDSVSGCFCPSVYDYRYSNGSCLPTCPSELWYVGDFGNGNGRHLCLNRCRGGFADLHDEWTCWDSCEDGEMIIRDNVVYCNKSAGGFENKTNTTTVHVYMRYDISLNEFKSLGYFSKYIILLSTYLDEFAPSRIKIVRLEQGSTIIELQIVTKYETEYSALIGGSFTWNHLTNAISNGEFNLGSVRVLNYHTRLGDEEKEEQKKEKSSQGLAIGIAVALGVVAIVLLGACVLYQRYKKKQRLMKEKEAKQAGRNGNKMDDTVGPVNNSAAQGLVEIAPSKIEVEVVVDPLKIAEGRLDLEKNEENVVGRLNKEDNDNEPQTTMEMNRGHVSVNLEKNQETVEPLKKENNEPQGAINYENISLNLEKAENEPQGMNHENVDVNLDTHRTIRIDIMRKSRKRRVPKESEGIFFDQTSGENPAQPGELIELPLVDDIQGEKYLVDLKEKALGEEEKGQEKIEEDEKGRNQDQEEVGEEEEKFLSQEKVAEKEKEIDQKEAEEDEIVIDLDEAEKEISQGESQDIGSDEKYVGSMVIEFN